MKPGRQNKEAGASLLLVLVVLLVVSVVVTGLLGFTQVSFQASGDVRSIRQQNYSADAAVELGIRRVLADPDYGAVGYPCSFTLAGANGQTATVTCAPANGTSGLPTGRVRNAILTLSSTQPLQLTGQDRLYVTGNVYSHASIQPDTSNNSILSVTGSIVAHDAAVCDPSNVKVTATVGKRCVTSTTSAGLDPDWAAQPAVSTPGSVSCPPPKKIAIFTPGKYTANPTSLLGSCNPTTLYFPPGVYYLEQPFNTGNYDVVAGADSGTWLAAGQAAPTDDTACDSTRPGAQFLLGNQGAIVMPNQVQAMTICAGPAVGGVPAIAIYGVKASGGGLLAHQAAVGLYTNEKKPSVFMHGTVYMTHSQAQISVFNKAKTYYTGGFVVDSMIAAINASTKQPGDPIWIPGCSSTDRCTNNRQVSFTSTIGPNTWIKAQVDVDDGFGASPGSGAKVASWSVRR
jgi:hypothetical protein